MVHKNYKWNISKEKGKSLALENIDEILSEQKNNSIDLNELIFLLNSRTKLIEITNNKKRKNIINFLKINYGGIQRFIEECENLEIFNDKDTKVIIIKKSSVNINELNINELNDWVFIYDSD